MTNKETVNRATPTLHIIEVNHHIDGVLLKSPSYKESISIPFNNEPGAANPACDTAIAYLQKLGFNIIGWGVGGDYHDYYIATDTWKKIK